MPTYQPDKREFARRAVGVRVFPVFRSILSDQLTPVSAFRRLAGSTDDAFLLESVIGGEKIARYSFIGARPIARVEADDEQTVVYTAGDRRISKHDDPLVELESLLATYHTHHMAALPRFLGGAVGYAGYDLARKYEPIGEPPKDDRGIRTVQFGIYDEMVVFDHVRKLIHVVAHARLESGCDPGDAYDDACRRIEETIERLKLPPSQTIPPFRQPDLSDVSFQSTSSEQAFERGVDRCQEYIRAGDVFQVVLGQRLTSFTKVEPFDLYRALRVINPSPFMFYLQSPSVTLVGASPEILCRIEGRTVSTRPLAGTRPRGQNEAEDLGLEAELLADAKEVAEHTMLVDLGRNDIGRVCVPGSVKIDDLMSVERYSHVMHICSDVSGTLAEGRSAFDALRSVLPVGTVSGAPKIRAMQIIDELEPVRRGPYAGAVGYIDFAGNMDTCIALRTLVVTDAEEGRKRVDVQVGAGIVADSEPSREYQETMNKAKAMLSALQLAESWSDQEYE